jgi:hypothetical protein
MSEPVTKEQLDDALSRLKSELSAQLDQALAKQKAELKEELIEAIRDAQTEILKAFFPFQEATEVRFRKMEADQSNSNYALNARVNIVERRLQEIEKKLLINPPPPES